jgi:hypothetical protein
VDQTEAGQVLFRAGDASLDFIVVLESALEVVDDFVEGAVELDERGFVLTGER